MSEDTMTDTSVEEPIVTEQPVEEVIVDEPVIEQPEPLTIEQIEAMLLEQFPPEPTPDPFPHDPTATWVYWSDMDTADRGVPDEWVWERLRNRRNALLAACDWRVVADAPWDTAPWLAYRQALRDLPDNTTDPRKADWPVEP